LQHGRAFFRLDAAPRAQVFGVGSQGLVDFRHESVRLNQECEGLR
jgi:hypothetical protein